VAGKSDMKRFRNNPAQRRAIIQATIGHLRPFRRGYALTKQGPFFSLRTIQILVQTGALRHVQNAGDFRRLTARAE